MKVCALCGRELDVGRSLPRKATCQHCGGDLHICLNCRFHSRHSHNQCIEPKSEFQRSRDKANFCDFFQYREGCSSGKGSGDEAQKARDALKDLFKD